MTPEESALLSDFGTQIFYQISALICTCTFYGEFKSAASFKLLSQLTQTVRRISSSSIYCILLVLVRAISNHITLPILILSRNYLVVEGQQDVRARSFSHVSFLYYSQIPGFLSSNVLQIWSRLKWRSCRIGLTGTWQHR